MIYETPAELATMLARWMPKDAHQILDPCVGTGALVWPVLRRGGSQLRVFAVDRDAHVLGLLRQELHSAREGRVSLFRSDFLKWTPVREEFDGVIMNPPFASRKDQWARTTTPDGADRVVPTEIAFVLKALKVTKTGGRVLAVVPGSIVSGELFKWLRRGVMQTAAVRVVHELPAFSFEKVEGRSFLLVLEKGARKRIILLRNHRLVKPDEIRRRVDDLGSGLRWDFGHHAAKQYLQMLIEAMPDGQWTRVNKLAEVDRGSVDAPWGQQRVIHSTDREDGFWHLKPKLRRAAYDKIRSVQAGDVLLVRVGRRCSQTAGLVVGDGRATMSSCLWRLRTVDGVDTIRFLFALRTLLGVEEIAGGLERGTGSAFITRQDIASVRVPMNLFRRFPKLFARYQKAVRDRCFSHMERIERTSRLYLCRVLDK